jgi:hypothetical protein
MAKMRATVLLGSWPPPTIELHALLAALNDSTGNLSAEPSTAFQHLNEIELTFTLDATPDPPLDAQGQKAVHRAMAAVYDGPVTVHVHLDLDVGGRSRPQRVVDVRAALVDRLPDPLY